MSGRGKGGGRGGRGRGGGGARGAGGRGEGGGANGKKDDFQDEFDVVHETRQIKGDDGDDEDFAGRGGDNDFEGDDDEDVKTMRRMTKQFAWEEDRMEEEYNEAGDRMEPFNLKNERTEGFFDETGNFVWKKEAGNADPWLDSLENEEDLEARIGEAASAQRKREEEEAQVEEPPEEVDKEYIMEKLIRIMQPQETVLRALKRLGPKREAAGSKRGGKATVKKPLDELTAEEKNKFDDLTELADQLLRAGEVEIYEKSREDLQAAVSGVEEAAAAAASSEGGGLLRANRKRPAAEMANTSKAGGIQWEYKGPDGQVHGPYSTADIIQWRSQGFFTGPTAVEMRIIKRQAQPNAHASANEDDGTGSADQPKAKKVSFSAEALVADFDDDDDDEDDGAGGAAANVASKKAGGGGEEELWRSSDEIDFSAYHQ